jgi:tRNA(fMet)-specific endonuclease VapC
MDCAVSTITAYELFTGVAKCSDPPRENAKVEKLLNTVHMLPFDAAAAIEAGKIRADLESRGSTIGPYDILLAGHAIAAGLVLVTANTGEFSRVAGLALESWRK